MTTQLHRIIATLEDLVFLISADGCLRNCYNTEGNPLLLPIAEFMSKPYREVLPTGMTQQLDAAIARLACGQTQRERFDHEINRDDSSRWFSCTVKPMPPVAGEAPCYSAVIRDITAEVRQSESIRHKEQALIASATANEALLKTRNIVQAASIGLRELGVTMKVDRCYMFRCSWNEGLQENVSNQLLEWTNDFIEPQINNPELQDVPFSLTQPFMDALLRNQPYACIVRELPEDCSLRQILALQNIKSLIALPIQVDGQLWGFVGFDDCRQERAWSNADTSILASFATSIASAITRGRTEEDLEKAKTEAEAANKAKSIFLSNITHEIRTPLHGVIGYAEMLASFPFPQPEGEYFNNIRLSANTLYELINNILDFSKIEAGMLEFNPENYLLADIVKSAIASVSYLQRVTGNRVHAVIDETALPTVIHVDATRLRQILVNLLSNALKFSADQIVELSVQLLPEGLRFSIHDRGIGISAEQLKQLFTPFTQFDSSFAKKYQGSGLGLSITRHILNLMGSKPEVESTPGQGSTFSFTLPLDSIQPREAGAAPPIQASGDLAQLVLDVLVVEDNRLNMLLAETMLQDLAPRLRVHKATNGMEAIQLIEGGLAPDLVLMDLQMPVMDGFETTRIIRDLYQTPLHVVALTASAMSDVRDRCLESGMNEFLTKPFTRDQIAQLLQRHVPLH